MLIEDIFRELTLLFKGNDELKSCPLITSEHLVSNHRNGILLKELSYSGSVSSYELTVFSQDIGIKQKALMMRAIRSAIEQHRFDGFSFKLENTTKAYVLKLIAKKF